MSGDELKNLLKYPNLQTIKFGANNVTTFAQVEVLKELKNLKNLDLVGSPFSETPNYRERILENFPELAVLDNITRDGEEYISEDEESDGYGDEEEGEGEGDDGGEEPEFEGEDADYGDEEGEFDDEDYGEEGEDEDDEEESAELGKRKK